MSRTEMPAPTIWFDTEPLLVQSDNNPRPTGIERVSLELFAEAERTRLSGGAARLFRISFYTGQPKLVDPADVSCAYANRAWAPLRPAYRHILPVLRDVRGIFKRAPTFESVVNPGDVVICLGDFWFNKRYARHIARLKARYRVKFGLLVHDLAPIVIPDHFPSADAAKFRALIADMLRISDFVFVCSGFTGSALRAFARERSIPLPRVVKLTFGAGFRDSARDSRPTPVQFPAKFVLYVSSIEARKNHVLLLRVWERLIAKHGMRATPHLVFVGQKMWRSQLVTGAVAASRELSEKVVFLSSLSDHALHQAYQRCLFTVYPSSYEGWGLPVAESLVHGKHCVVSNATSLPEVGGDFADYHDPNDEDAAFDKIERAIFDAAYRTSREERIRREYVPPTWSDCMHSLISTVCNSDV